jgi:hypothetical protein
MRRTGLLEGAAFHRQVCPHDLLAGVRARGAFATLAFDASRQGGATGRSPTPITRRPQFRTSGGFEERLRTLRKAVSEQRPA